MAPFLVSLPVMLLAVSTHAGARLTCQLLREAGLGTPCLALRALPCGSENLARSTPGGGTCSVRPASPHAGAVLRSAQQPAPRVCVH